MISEHPDSAIQLNLLAEAIRTAEDEHHQDVPLREDFDHVPVGCSCGVQYNPKVGWAESKGHLREVAAQAVLAALHRPCESCLGTGTWVKMRAEFECPVCEGRGRTLPALPPMVFQDRSGAAWAVADFDDTSADAIWVLVRRDR